MNGQVFRCSKILIGKYKVLKKKTAKNRLTAKKDHSTGTGVGPNIPITITSTDLEIKYILDKTRIKRDRSEFWSDCFVSLIDGSVTIQTGLKLNFIDNIEENNNGGLIN